MTTRRPTRRSTKAPVVPQTPQAVSARKLPMFGPNIPIDVALPILPAYYELYTLVPLTRREVQDLKNKGMRKPDGVVWVKRVPKEKKSE